MHISKYRIVFVAAFFLLPFFSAMAQTVSYVSFRQDGQKVVISYGLSEQADVAVEVSTDGGITFGATRMTHVSGDVGTDVAPGQSKNIVWDVLQDCDGLQGDRICFRITANKCSTNQTFTVGVVSFTMVYVEGGTFTMGCTSEQGNDCWDNEIPSHKVTLGDYYIGETEVTQALWKAVMGDNPSIKKGDMLPVENVSYNDCLEFIDRLNSMTGLTFRLPTEAEWEYAARGGNKSLGYKYSGSNSIDDVAWYYVNSGSKTHPVKGKRANELGLYDMTGNLWEWCSDWFGDYNSDSQTNPKGPSSGSNRVLRGGCRGCYSRNCRVTYRNGIASSYSGDYSGFRLAR